MLKNVCGSSYKLPDFLVRFELNFIDIFSKNTQYQIL